MNIFKNIWEVKIYNNKNIYHRKKYTEMNIQIL